MFGGQVSQFITDPRPLPNMLFSCGYKVYKRLQMLSQHYCGRVQSKHFAQQVM